MKNVLSSALVALFLSVSLSACADKPGGILTTSNLSAAQTAAASILQVVKTEAGIYIQQPGVTTAQATTINLAVSSLSAAVASFQAISSFGNVNQLATAVLTTASAVVSLLPNISPSEKVAITGGVAILEALLPVVLPAVVPSPAAAPSAPGIMLTPGTLTVPFNSVPVSQ